MDFNDWLLLGAALEGTTKRFREMPGIGYGAGFQPAHEYLEAFGGYNADTRGFSRQWVIGQGLPITPSGVGGWNIGTNDRALNFTSPQAQRALNFAAQERALNFAHGQVSGAFGASRAIPWDEIEAQNAKIEQLNTDVRNWTAKNPGSTTPETQFFLRWQPWYMGWQVQFADWARRSADLPLGVPRAIVGDEAVGKFEVLQRQYDEVLRQAQSAGVPTAAPPSAMGSPLDRFFAKLKPALPWILIGGLLIVLAPYLGTALAAIAMKRSAGKAAAGALLP